MSAAVNINPGIVMELIAQRTPKHPKDQWIGFAIALLVHLALLFIGGMIFIKQAEFGVDQGLSSMEVQLVAAPQEPVVEPVEQLPEPVENLEAIQTPIIQKVEEKAAVTPVASSQGAVTEVKPSYLKNPAPRYPLEARRQGWEGTVVLEVFVDNKGSVSRAQIQQSSGHTVLDESALKTVKTWSFRPARLGSMNVESSVVVPVRFDLKDPRFK